MSYHLSGVSGITLRTVKIGIHVHAFQKNYKNEKPSQPSNIEVMTVEPRDVRATTPQHDSSAGGRGVIRPSHYSSSISPTMQPQLQAAAYPIHQPSNHVFMTLNGLLHRISCSSPVFATKLPSRQTPRKLVSLTREK